MSVIIVKLKNGEKHLVIDSQGDLIQIKVGDGLFEWIPRSSVENVIAEMPDQTSFNGEFAQQSQELEDTIRNANKLTIGELVVALIDASNLIKKHQKLTEHVMDQGTMSVRKMAKVMNCYIDDLTKDM